MASSSTDQRLMISVRAPATSKARRSPNTPSPAWISPTPVSHAESTAQSDGDNDGVLNGVDNCIYIANPDPSDTNSNGVGDECEPSRFKRFK